MESTTLNVSFLQKNTRIFLPEIGICLKMLRIFVLFDHRIGQQQQELATFASGYAGNVLGTFGPLSSFVPVGTGRRGWGAAPSDGNG